MVKKIWLDIETTGVDFDKCAITQLAGIIEKDGEVVYEFDLRMKPFEGAEISAQALRVTNTSYDEMMTWPDPAEVLDEFIMILASHVDRMVKSDNFTIAAYNGHFDVQFISKWFERHNKKFFAYLNYHYMDPLALIRIIRWEGGANLESYKLSSVYKALFNESFDAHDALADIRATRRIYEELRRVYLCL